ncbi:MAG: deoxyribodipyrimidine photo-lyase, partial [Hyphomicrobiales bacterium]
MAAISSHPVIMWFTRDLRVHDNRALHAAIASGAPVVPVYVLDKSAPIGGAQRWWLHHSLSALGDALSSIGLKLVLRRGDTNTILRGLISETYAQGLYCARTYEPAAQKLEQDIKQLCTEMDIECHRYTGQLLFEPERVHTPSGTPYKVFTPFSKLC